MRRLAPPATRRCGSLIKTSVAVIHDSLNAYAGIAPSKCNASPKPLTAEKNTASGVAQPQMNAAAYGVKYAPLKLSGTGSMPPAEPMRATSITSGGQRRRVDSAAKPTGNTAYNKDERPGRETRKHHFRITRAASVPARLGANPTNPLHQAPSDHMKLTRRDEPLTGLTKGIT